MKSFTYPFKKFASMLLILGIFVGVFSFDVSSVRAFTLLCSDGSTNCGQITDGGGKIIATSSCTIGGVANHGGQTCNTYDSTAGIYDADDSIFFSKTQGVIPSTVSSTDPYFTYTQFYPGMTGSLYLNPIINGGSVTAGGMTLSYHGCACGPTDVSGNGCDGTNQPPQQYTSGTISPGDGVNLSVITQCKPNDDMFSVNRTATWGYGNAYAYVINGAVSCHTAAYYQHAVSNGYMDASNLGRSYHPDPNTRSCVPDAPPHGTISAQFSTCTLPCAPDPLTWSVNSTVTAAKVTVDGKDMDAFPQHSSKTIPSDWIDTTPLVFNLYDETPGNEGALLSSTTVTGIPASNPTSNPSCGTASKSYPNGTGNYGTDTFCATGSSSPASPVFPVAGSSTAWTCNNGGSTTISCSASQAAAPVCKINSFSVNYPGTTTSIPSGSSVPLSFSVSGTGGEAWSISPSVTPTSSGTISGTTGGGGGDTGTLTNITTDPAYITYKLLCGGTSGLVSVKVDPVAVTPLVGTPVISVTGGTTQAVTPGQTYVLPFSFSNIKAGTTTHINCSGGDCHVNVGGGLRNSDAGNPTGTTGDY